MPTSDDRDALIDRISRMQRDLGRSWAHNRSSVLLGSTLTMQQLKTVMVLSHREPLSGQELAHAVGVGLGTMTGIVDRLVARNLATRHEDPADRRVRRVALTDEGKAAAEELMDAGLAEFRRVLTRLDVETLRSLEHVLGKILDAARELQREEQHARYHAHNHQNE